MIERRRRIIIHVKRRNSSLPGRCSFSRDSMCWLDARLDLFTTDRQAPATSLVSLLIYDFQYHKIDKFLGQPTIKMSSSKQFNRDRVCDWLGKGAWCRAECQGSSIENLGSPFGKYCPKEVENISIVLESWQQNFNKILNSFCLCLSDDSASNKC